MDTQNNEIEPKIEDNSTRKFSPKVLGIVIVVLILAGLAFYYKNLWIAATVDGHIISRWSVIQKLEKQNGRVALDGLIDDKLISNEAKKKNITITDEDINKKLDTIKSQIEASGGTIDAALASAGLTMDDLKKQIILQLKLEKLLGDKINVTDEEVDKNIKDNKIPVPAGQEAQTKDQIREQMKSDKFGNEAGKYIADLKVAAKIKNFVSY